METVERVSLARLVLGESDNTRDSAEEQRRESNVEAEVIEVHKVTE